MTKPVFFFFTIKSGDRSPDERIALPAPRKSQRLAERHAGQEAMEEEEKGEAPDEEKGC